jgi:hypothetical protein
MRLGSPVIVACYPGVFTILASGVLTRCREETSHVQQHIHLAGPQSQRRFRWKRSLITRDGRIAAIYLFFDKLA